jgi:hypothetical protein
MTRILDRQNLARWADWFAVAVALVLPWSTTFTAVLQNSFHTGFRPEAPLAFGRAR